MNFLIRDDTILASCSCLVTQSCPTLGDPTDCSPPGSSVHWILQARILEWVAVPSSREGIFLTQGSNLRFLRLLHCRWVLYRLSHGGHIMPLMRRFSPKHLYIQGRVSQPQHYWHCRPDNSWFSGPILYVVGCLAAFLASTLESSISSALAAGTTQDL